MTTTATPTTQVFRVQVAYHGATTGRAYGFGIKVEATSKDEAARIAEQRALALDAERTAKTNDDHVRLGRPDLQRDAWPIAKAEKVRRFAADNR